MSRQAALRSGVLLCLAVGTPVSRGQITVPHGFRAEVWRVSDLSSVTAIEADGPGRLFLGLNDGRVLLLEDVNHDGTAEDDTIQLFHTLPGSVNGLARRGSRLYVSNVNRIVFLEDLDGDDQADVEQAIVTGLPTGAHWANGLRFGPDGLLYIALGSTCDQCDEANPLSASILRCRPDGSNLRVFAHGVRNCYDLAFNAAGDLFGGDNSFNFGSTPSFPPDELNHYELGGDYGWPEQVGTPNAASLQHGPMALIAPHLSPNGICFYGHRAFPRRWWGAGFVTLWGVFGPAPVPMPLLSFDAEPDGLGSYRATPQPFADGFLHPLDVVTDSTGDLFVAEFGQFPYSAVQRLYFEDLAVGGDFRLGGTLDLTLRGNPGDLYVLFAAPGTAFLPLGRSGVLRLDPATMTPILAGLLPASAERTLSFPIPIDPQLAGIPIHNQLLRHDGVGLFFGVRASYTLTP